MLIPLKEHESLLMKATDISTQNGKFLSTEDLLRALENHPPRKIFATKENPYLITIKEDGTLELKGDYYVGVDWLIPGVKAIQIESKLNQSIVQLFENKLEHEESEQNSEIENKSTTEVNQQLNILKMLMEVYTSNIEPTQIKNVIEIFWTEPPITIEQSDDLLSPFLIVQFLCLLKIIVRKGLKKSYYKVKEHLRNKAKGKILLTQHIKQNIFKNKDMYIACEYQVFGIDTLENRFLKKVLQFCQLYVENHHFHDKAEMIQLIHYCRPAFEHISNNISDDELKHCKHNPFFKEYQEAIRIGKLILNRFAYNINNTSEQKVAIPPFWINMPELFELYVYKKLLEQSNLDRKITYQFSTYGNKLDFLITGNDPLIIDTKYKLKYERSHIHRDIRQVSGYARLNKVRQKVGFSDEDDKHIPCLIIYPIPETCASQDFILDNYRENPIRPYYKVYKLGIPVPML